MKWNILAVDDDVSVIRQIKEFLDGRIDGSTNELAVDVTDDFDKALQELDKMLYDLIVLDVFKGKQAMTVKTRPGEDILKEIRKRCFIPVIFYTALPAAVSEYESNLVRVVHKTAGGLSKLKEAVGNLINTGLPAVNRVLINHFFRVQGEYMWKFVEPNWEEFSRIVDPKSLAYLLSRRLAISLTRENIQYLIDSLGGSGGATTAGGDFVHPVEHYIYPPIDRQYNTGDILAYKKKKTSYGIILTPSCDMFQDDARKAKSEYVLVAECITLPETEEGRKWIQAGGNDAREELKAFIQNNKKRGQRERYYYLPGTFFIPHLFVDFQKISTISFDELKKSERIATLDSPFAECLLNRFCRYMGRIGTPDIHQSEIDGIIDSLKKKKKKKK